MQNPSVRSTLRAHASRRRELTPEVSEAFQTFQNRVFADGALDRKTKQIIAVALAHATQCHLCIQSHTRSALNAGATPRELMEAAWIAAEMRAGGAYAHSNVMLSEIQEYEAEKRPSQGAAGSGD